MTLLIGCQALSGRAVFTCTFEKDLGGYVWLCPSCATEVITGIGYCHPKLGEEYLVQSVSITLSLGKVSS